MLHPRYYLKQISDWVIYSLVFLACLVSILMISPAWGHDDLDRETCTYKGKKLYGKILVVESFPDLKVRETNSFPDLKVKYVSSFPDLTIKFVNSFPGLR